MLIDNMVLIEEFRKLLSNAYIHIFAWVVLFDILTGITKSWYGKTSNSTKGLLGVVKHILVVCLVLIAYPYMTILGYEMVAVAFVTSFIVTYVISIAENWGQLGWPMPKYIRDHLEKLKERERVVNRSDYGNGQSETENTIYKDQDQSKG